MIDIFFVVRTNIIEISRLKRSYKSIEEGKRKIIIRISSNLLFGFKTVSSSIIRPRDVSVNGAFCYKPCRHSYLIYNSWLPKPWLYYILVLLLFFLTSNTRVIYCSVQKLTSLKLSVCSLIYFSTFSRQMSKNNNYCYIFTVRRNLDHSAFYCSINNLLYSRVGIIKYSPRILSNSLSLPPNPLKLLFSILLISY